MDCGLWSVTALCLCVPARSMLQCVTDERPDIRVQVANGASVAVECVGSVSCSVQTSGGEGLLTLTGVLVVPGFVHNLFSCEWGGCTTASAHS